MGLGFRCGEWSAQHNHTVVQTVRRKLHTTLNNIFTVLTLSRIEIGTPKSPYIQSVMLTLPLHHRGTQLNICTLTNLFIAYKRINQFSWMIAYFDGHIILHPSKLVQLKILGRGNLKMNFLRNFRPDFFF